jgi:hypothetical protein
MDENQSVVKAASANDFNRDQTQRLIESFNTAKTIYYFKSATDRSSAFPVADPDVVIPALFGNAEQRSPETEKAAADLTLTDYSYYEIPEAEHYGGFDMDKEGHNNFPLPEPDLPSGYTLDILASSINKKIRTAKQAAQRCQDSADQLDLMYEMGVNDIANAIRDGYDTPEKMAQAEHYMWEAHGKEIAEPVFMDIAACIPEQLHKRAHAGLEGRVSTFANQYPKIASMASDCLKARFGAAEMRAVQAICEKEAQEITQSWNEAAGLVEPPQEVDDFLVDGLAPKSAQALPVDLGDSKGTGKAAPRSTPGFLDQSIAAGAGAAGSGVTEALKPEISRTMSSILAGDAEAEEQKTTNTLKMLQRQLLLEDLVVNDPVLKNETPETIANAYQALVSLAPRVSLNKEVTRAVLRNTVQTVALHPHDAKSMVELNNELQKQVDLLRGTDDRRGR